MERLVRPIWGAVLALLVAGPAAEGRPKPAEGKKPVEVKMTVRDVKQQGPSYVVLLQNEAGDKILPIWIGDREAQAIQMRLTNSRSPRPMTHDLLETILAQLKAKITRVEVDDLKDNVFHGKLTLSIGGKLLRIDGRPSDLITLAVGARLPVFVAPHVLEKGALKPRPPAEQESPGQPQEI